MCPPVLVEAFYAIWGCVKSLSATEGGSQRILHLSVFISRAKLLYICLVFSNLAV